MIISARFIKLSQDAHPSSHVSASLQGRGFQGFVTFLIDTGADCTVLWDIHVRRLRIPATALTPAPTAVVGIGGSTPASILSNVALTFTTDSGVHTLQQDIWVMPHSSSASALPAILGRDVINQFRFTCDLQVNLAELAG